MNTKNNKRRQATRERVERVFVELLQTRKIAQITVSELCQRAEINRSTFYANYLDVFDLADQIRDRLEQEVEALYENGLYFSWTDYLRLFRHIRENQGIYNTYFKLGYDSKHLIDLGSLPRSLEGIPETHLDYHVQFHKAGLNAIIKQWLATGCQEPPEVMAQIIRDEYTRRR